MLLVQIEEEMPLEEEKIHLQNSMFFIMREECFKVFFEHDFVHFILCLWSWL